MIRYPVIVLDGPDGTGKSTLARSLSARLDAHHLHLTYRWPNNMFDYHSAALFYVLRKAQTQPVVLDRWWPSEVVYADAYRGGSNWPLAYRMLEKVALRFGFSYIFCLPHNKEEYLQFYNVLKGKRVEMYDSGMDRVYDGYTKLYNELMVQREAVDRYDFFEQGQDLDRACQDIIELTEDHRALIPRVINDNSFMNITGDVIHSRYVFVGDELKHKTRRELWPFFEYSASNLFLAQTLENMGVLESDLMFINAKHPRQDETDDMLSFLWGMEKKFIALGSKASEHLLKLGIRHRLIVHPQYYRRFARDTIVSDLRKAMQE